MLNKGVSSILGTNHLHAVAMLEMTVMPIVFHPSSTEMLSLISFSTELPWTDWKILPHGSPGVIGKARGLGATHRQQLHELEDGGRFHGETWATVNGP